MENDSKKQWIAGAVAMVMACVALPAWAHHPTGGETPASAMQGLLSGLGHPVIEFDHLAFLIALGLLTSLVDNGRLRLIVPFVVFSLLGTYAHTQGVTLALPEMWIGLSLIVVAGLLLRPLRVGTGVAVVFCVLAALVHGYAFGEAVVGARTSAIVSYLVGLGLIQSAMLWLVGTGIRHVGSSVRPVLIKASAGVSALLGILALTAGAL
ncbi:HupE/UreJ family protein [Orrella marina]|uniref:Urease accessory protein UreJ n=1 Tax=Orrella marina TaxID=2163011 RepID=A0A2R4XN33_9BURK|nr:HupE/UreJ family protein [Orrella marina]AWB35119.1 urease accessory protein UreJ [Orrella marina]